MRIIIFRIKCLLSIPFYLWFRLGDYGCLLEELRRWEEVLPVVKYKNDFFAFIRMFAAFPEYRSLFLFRVGLYDFRFLISHQKTLHIISDSEVLGKGLVFQHGFSSIIFPESLGENCQIWHNVTIGRARDKGARPKIGNNVRVCAGAILLGDITIGDNVTIAAGCVVVKSIPANCLVVGNPAYIIKRNGIKVHECL